MLEAMQLAKSQSDLTDYWPVGLYGDCNIGKVRQIKLAQLAFRCTINIMLLTYLLQCCFFFSVLTLLVGCQEGHLACKNLLQQQSQDFLLGRLSLLLLSL